MSRSAIRIKEATSSSSRRSARRRSSARSFRISRNAMSVCEPTIGMPPVGRELRFPVTGKTTIKSVTAQPYSSYVRNTTQYANGLCLNSRLLGRNYDTRLQHAAAAFMHGNSNAHRQQAGIPATRRNMSQTGRLHSRSGSAHVIARNGGGVAEAGRDRTAATGRWHRPVADPLSTLRYRATRSAV